VSKDIRDVLKMQALTQIEEVINSYEQFHCRVNNPADDDHFHMEQIISSARLAIERVCPPSYPLVKQMETVLAGPCNDYVKTDKIAAIAMTLKNALENDNLVLFEELIHGELFSDFLDMAEHLLAEGFKDAAAVIAGGTLESHLRHLCIKNGIALTVTKKCKTVSKTASPLNDDLVAAKVFPKTQHKMTSGFIGIRNDASHGDYEKYSAADVNTMILGIRAFQCSYPA
jgi:hypothetical protein